MTGKNNLLVGPNTGLHITIQNNVVLFGDNVSPKVITDGDVIVGDTLWGKLIPREVKQLIYDNPVAVHKLIVLLTDARHTKALGVSTDILNGSTEFSSTSISKDLGF